MLVHLLPYGVMSKRCDIYINQWPVTGESIGLLWHDGSGLENPRKKTPEPWQPHANYILKDLSSKLSFTSPIIPVINENGIHFLKIYAVYFREIYKQFYITLVLFKLVEMIYGHMKVR